MKVTGLDRVVLLVKDLDKAMEFFSKKLGMEFTELPGIEAMGQRAAASLDHQMELISPVSPLPKGVSPHVKRWARVLEKKDNVLVAISFMVDDADAAAVDLEKAGMRIEARFDIPEIPPWSVRNLKELIMVEEDTLGIPMAFSHYERT